MIQNSSLQLAPYQPFQSFLTVSFANQEQRIQFGAVLFGIWKSPKWAKNKNFQSLNDKFFKKIEMELVLTADEAAILKMYFEDEN